MTPLVAGALLLAVSGAVGAQAEDRREMERRRMADYEGRVLTLRSFYTEDHLQFNREGQQVKKSKVGPWTLYGKIQITNLRLRRGRFEIDGSRLFFAYDKKAKRFQTYPTDLKVFIEIESSPQPDAAVLEHAMAKVFLSARDTLADVAPPYWKRFLSEENKEGKERKAEPQRSEFGDVYRIDKASGVLPPRLVHRAEPQYTEPARRLKFDGTVILDTVVNKEGRIERIDIREPLGMGLDEEAVAAISQWRFEPGRRNGEPVSVYATIEVTFRVLK